MKLIWLQMKMMMMLSSTANLSEQNLPESAQKRILNCYATALACLSTRKARLVKFFKMKHFVLSFSRRSMKLGSVPKKSWPKDVVTLKKNKSRWQENNKRKLKSKPRPRLTTSNQRSKTSGQRLKSWNQSTTLEGKPMRPSLRKRPWRRSLSKTDMLKKPKLSRWNKWLRRNNLKPLQSVR